MERKVYVSPAPGRTPFAVVLDRWLTRKAAQVQETTIETYEARIRAHIASQWGSRQVATITRDEVEAWISGLPCTRSTAAGVWVIFRGVMAEAVAEGMIVSSPCDTAVAPRFQKGRNDPPPEREAVEAIIAALPDRHRVVGEVAKVMGMRLGEVMGLTRADIMHDTRKINVDKQVITPSSGRGYLRAGAKWGSNRVLPVPPTSPLLAQLAEHMLAFPSRQPDGLIFTTRTGNMIRRNDWYDIWRRACRSADVHVRFKDLRRFCASDLIKRGVDVRFIKEFLGHKSVDTTYKAYIGLWPDDLAEALAAAFASG
jgi:integrase